MEIKRVGEGSRIDIQKCIGDIEDVVRPVLVENQKGFVVNGKLRNGTLNITGKNAKLVIIPISAERDDWMHTVRVRVSPWQILLHRAKELRSSKLSSDAMNAISVNIEKLFNTKGALPVNESHSGKTVYGEDDAHKTAGFFLYTSGLAETIW